MKRIGYLSMACAVALTVGCSDNATRSADATNRAPGTVATTGETELVDRAGTDADKSFVEKSMVAGMTEVELGKMATDRAVNPAVKHFAQMMVTDHSKAGDALKQVADQHHLAVSPMMDQAHKDVIGKLSPLKGAEFDREYMDVMVQSHEDVIDHLQTRIDVPGLLTTDRAKHPVAEKSDNPATAAVNQWAANTLPTARGHLEEAKRIQDGLQSRRNTTN